MAKYLCTASLEGSNAKAMDIYTKTLEKVLVPGRKVVKFKVGQTMKEIVRKNLEESEKRK